MKIVLTLILVTAVGVGIYLYQSGQSSMVTDLASAQVKMAQDTVMKKGEETSDAAKSMMMDKAKDMLPGEGGELLDKVMDPQSAAKYMVSEGAPVKGAKNVLFFHASWCPTCRVADAEISAKTASLPAGTIVHKVDYDTHADLKRTYGITQQHTFVYVDESGAVIKKWSGGGLAEIKAAVM